MVDLASFQLDPDGRVYVNGEELAGVASVRVDRVAGMPHPVVTITHHADVAPITGQGVVWVPVADTGPDPLAEVLRWLGALDPEQLEQQALDRQGWGSGSLAAEVLAVLADLARDQLQ